MANELIPAAKIAVLRKKEIRIGEGSTYYGQ